MSPLDEISIDRRSTPEQIARGLTRLVLSGELPPGRPLRESALATELGVSRNTVREAVRILERSGLVRYRLNHGAVVREPSLTELADVYRARSAIEVGAAWAVERTVDAVATVQAALDGLVAALRHDHADEAINADLDFHAALVASVGSERLDAAFAPVLNELRLYLTILSTRDEYADADRIVAEHQVIADALASGDRAKLATEVQDHIAINAARVSRILAE